MSKNLEKSEFQTLNPRIQIIHTLNDEIVKIEYCAEMKELFLKSQSRQTSPFITFAQNAI